MKMDFFFGSSPDNLSHLGVFFVYPNCICLNFHINILILAYKSFLKPSLTVASQARLLSVNMNSPHIFRIYHDSYSSDMLSCQSPPFDNKAL